MILIIDDKWYCFNRVTFKVLETTYLGTGSCTCTEVTVPGVTFTLTGNVTVKNQVFLEC